jgi:hypothetical protein
VYGCIVKGEVDMQYGALGHTDNDLDEDVRLGRHTEEGQEMDMDQFKFQRNQRPKKPMVNFDAGWQFWEFCHENDYNRNALLRELIDRFLKEQGLIVGTKYRVGKEEA